MENVLTPSPELKALIEEKKNVLEALKALLSQKISNNN